MTKIIDVAQANQEHSIKQHEKGAHIPRFNCSTLRRELNRTKPQIEDKEAVGILSDASETDSLTNSKNDNDNCSDDSMPKKEIVAEKEKTNYEEIIRKLKDDHEKEINQMREDYGFVIATLKLGSSSDAIIDLQAKINEQEHEMETMKQEFMNDKANLINKVKRAESANMFALRRNEEMSSKIYAMQIELEEMDDKHQSEIESYQEKLAALGGEKVKSKESSEKSSGNLRNKRKLMKKELEGLRNEHERKMESFANKIQEQKNAELKEMTEKIAKLENLVDEMKLGHIRAIKSLEEAHRDENIESLNKERERVKQLEADYETMKSDNKKTVDDLNRANKEEVDKVRRYYEKEIGELKRRKISKSQALRRKTSVDTASLILKALKEQNERDEQEELDKKKNVTPLTTTSTTNIENGSLVGKNLPSNTVDDMDLQQSMERIRLIYSEEFNKTTTTTTTTSAVDKNPTNLTSTASVTDSKKLQEENSRLTHKLNSLEEKHKKEIDILTQKLENLNNNKNMKINEFNNNIKSINKNIIKNNEISDAGKKMILKKVDETDYNNNREGNDDDKNNSEDDTSYRSIKQSIQRFDTRMESLRDQKTLLGMENNENKFAALKKSAVGGGEVKIIEHLCKEKKDTSIADKSPKVIHKVPLSETINRTSPIELSKMNRTHSDSNRTFGETNSGNRLTSDTAPTTNRTSVEITLKVGQQSQESSITRKTLEVPLSPKMDAQKKMATLQRPESSAVSIGNGQASPRLRQNLARKASGNVQRRKTLYENIYSGVLPSSEVNKT